MPVSSQETVFRHIGNGVTVTFAYGCQIPLSVDLKVYVNDVLTTTGFTTSGIGSLTGGTISFDVAPAAGVAVRIERDIELKRETNYQQNGDFLSRVVNPDFDRLWMALQQHLSILKRALVVPKSDATGPAPLPAIAARANKLLGFDANGDPVALALAAQSATALETALAGAGGAGLIGTAVGDTMQKFISRAAARLGRGAGTDLPRSMALLRNYRADTRPIVPIVGFGSSVGVGATLLTPLADAPVAWFKSQLKAYLDPGNIYNLTPYNYCVNGSIVSDFPASWAAMLAAGVTGPGVAVMAYGMNDQAPAQYNNGQTFPGFFTAFRAAVNTMKKAGWDVVILTTPHASIVRNPGIYSMPAGIPQEYPFHVNANVAPEAMSPPASQSKIVADFIGEGTAISVDHRALRINQAMRDVAKEFGCTLVDSERYWFEALQKYQLQTGSAAGAEGMLFNAGEAVHPNLLGHQVSYQAAITDFCKSLAWQSAQNNIEPRLNGYVGINLPNGLPGAILEIGTPYPDVTTPALILKQRTGVVDANGVKAEEIWETIDPATGDRLHGDWAATGGGWRENVTRNAANRALTQYVKRIGKAYGVTFTEFVEGSFNIQIATPLPTQPFPASSTGELTIAAQNGGIGTSPQMSKYRWKTSATTITLVADGADIGSGVFTVAVAGLTLNLTPIANNTNFQVRWTSLGT